ncbi:MAG: hypothetical protein LV479_00655 [Methylacidiphilales bacterium]|nr:hypothetical protein [Candidatus Methylacidiphilales bacterium]
MRPPTIAILFLERDRPENYAISAYAKIWEEGGIKVHHLIGIKTCVPADLLFLHVNLSVVPGEYLQFARRYPRAVNLHARDIRKRSFSSLVLSSDSDYQGEVIVKTDLNYGGVPETYLHPNPFFRLASRWQMLRRMILHPTRNWREDAVYPVYRSIREVPAACWRNRHWLVEKFIPERLDGHYVIRNYKFLGNRENTLLLVSEKPFIREDALISISPVENEPALQELRRKLRLDFGKFDYVLVDGTPVLIDINKTMGFNPNASHDPGVVKARRQLAEGIYDYLGEGCPRDQMAGLTQ